MQKELDALVRAVAPLDRSAMTAAEEHQARLAKPPGSLGRLEELSVQLAGITGKVHNELLRKQLLVFAADNGVVAEGVSSAPQSVTKQQTINLTRGKTGAAVLAVLLGADVEAVTGRGGGITEESFRKKKAVIRTAIEVNRPDRDDVVGVLSKVGGFDLAAMCGAFLGAAAARRPAVIDGLISAAAALCAVRLCPNVRGYLVPSHASFEIGYRLAMEAMDLRPLFDLGMRLGEGSGCPLAFQVLDAACAVINDMATFDEAGINDDYLDEIRRGDQFTP